MVVMISEQGENVRRAPPAECVVYGNTHVICDPSKTVYTEEYTLLAFSRRELRRSQPARREPSTGASCRTTAMENDVSADYTINSNNNGVM